MKRASFLVHGVFVFRLFVLVAIATLFASCFGGVSSSDLQRPLHASAEDVLVLHGLDIDGDPVILEYYVVPSELPLHRRVEGVVNRLSELYFRSREIDVVRFRGTAQGDIVVIDLRDPPSRTSLASSPWHQSFQGSLGGSQTQAALLHTLLQPTFPGEWFSGVEFLWNGVPMEPQDHVDLSGVFYRSELMWRNGPDGLTPFRR